MKAPIVYPFQANPAVLIETPENLWPTFWFEVFLNDKVIKIFVAETNSYGEFVKTWNQQTPQKWECL